MKLIQHSKQIRNLPLPVASRIVPASLAPLSRAHQFNEALRLETVKTMRSQSKKMKEDLGGAREIVAP